MNVRRFVHHPQHLTEISRRRRPERRCPTLLGTAHRSYWSRRRRERTERRPPSPWQVRSGPAAADRARHRTSCRRRREPRPDRPPDAETPSETRIESTATRASITPPSLFLSRPEVDFYQIKNKQIHRCRRADKSHEPRSWFRKRKNYRHFITVCSCLYRDFIEIIKPA